MPAIFVYLAKPCVKTCYVNSRLIFFGYDAIRVTKAEIIITL